MQDMLKSIQDSSMELYYRDAEVKEGDCQDEGMHEKKTSIDADVQKCFPKASFWSTGKASVPLHAKAQQSNNKWTTYMDYWIAAEHLEDTTVNAIDPFNSFDLEGMTCLP